MDYWGVKTLFKCQNFSIGFHVLVVLPPFYFVLILSPTCSLIFVFYRSLLLLYCHVPSFACFRLLIERPNAWGRSTWIKYFRMYITFSTFPPSSIWFSNIFHTFTLFMVFSGVFMIAIIQNKKTKWSALHIILRGYAHQHLQFLFLLKGRFFLWSRTHLLFLFPLLNFGLTLWLPCASSR